MEKIAQFEQSIRELETILETINRQDTSLDESIGLYARAAQLLAQCRLGLEQARVKIEEIDLLLNGQAEEDG